MHACIKCGSRCHIAKDRGVTPTYKVDSYRFLKCYKHTWIELTALEKNTPRWVAPSKAYRRHQDIRPRRHQEIWPRHCQGVSTRAPRSFDSRAKYFWLPCQDSLTLCKGEGFRVLRYSTPGTPMAFECYFLRLPWSRWLHRVPWHTSTPSEPTFRRLFWQVKQPDAELQ
jgi:hypothetical protein